MNYDGVHNEEDLAFLQTIYAKLTHNKCNASLIFIYEHFADSDRFEELNITEKIKILNLATHCYLELDICDLDILCSLILDYLSEIIDGTYGLSDIIDLYLDRQSDY